MRTVLLALLLPLTVLAQVTFGPVRLDEQQGINYFYPRIQVENANVLCMWSSVLPDTETGLVATHGIQVSPDGQLLNRINFQEVEYGRIYCPGEITLLHATDGSDPYMIYHS